MSGAPLARSLASWLVVFALVSSLAGCAGFGTPVAPEATLVNLVPLETTPFEQRVRVELRLRNLDRRDLSFHGLDFAIDVNGSPMLRGSSNEGGLIPGYGEILVSVEGSTTVVDLLRQFLAIGGAPRDDLGYDIRGRLHREGRWQQSVPFSSPRR